jgi:hypothetical protein
MPNVTLTIRPAEDFPGHFLVLVEGEGFFRSPGANVSAQIRSGDDWFDEKPLPIATNGSDRVGREGSFTLSAMVPGGKLADDRWGDNEIYALVKIKGLSGAFKSSNRVVSAPPHRRYWTIPMNRYQNAFNEWR